MLLTFVLDTAFEQMSKSRERGTGQYKRCKCPLWLRWGKDSKKSAKTRSWDIATKAARKLEQELELAANGIEPPKKPDHITVQSAVDLYLSDMAQRGIKDLSKARRMLSRLQDYANGKKYHLAQGCHCTTANRMAERLDI